MVRQLAVLSVIISDEVITMHRQVVPTKYVEIALSIKTLN
jgi:hypothetical protein